MQNNQDKNVKVITLKTDLSPDDAIMKFIKAINDDIKDMKQLINDKPFEKDVLTVSDVCNALDISEQTLISYDKKGYTTPYFLADGCRQKYYKRSEVFQFMNRSKGKK